MLRSAYLVLSFRFDLVLSRRWIKRKMIVVRRRIIVEQPLIQTMECRICQEEDSVSNLKTPCACRGSLKDTFKFPPAEHKTMKNATMLSITITTLFYLMCGSMGYAALEIMYLEVY